MPVYFEYNESSCPFDDEVDPSSNFQEGDTSPGWSCQQWRHESRISCRVGYENTNRSGCTSPKILRQNKSTLRRNPYRTGCASEVHQNEVSSSPSEKVIQLRPEFFKGCVTRSRPRSLGPWGNQIRRPYRTGLPINVSSIDVTSSQPREVFKPQRSCFHNDGNLPRRISTISLWSNLPRSPYRLDHASGDTGSTVTQCKSVNEMKFSSQKYVLHSQFSDQQILLSRRPYRGALPKSVSNIRVSPSDIVAKRLSVYKYLQTRSQSLGRLNRQYRKPYRSGNAIEGPVASTALSLSDSEVKQLRATKFKDQAIQHKTRSHVQRIYRFRKPYRPTHTMNDLNKETKQLSPSASPNRNLSARQSHFRTRLELGDAEKRASSSICITASRKMQLDKFESCRQTHSQSLGQRNYIQRQPYRTEPEVDRLSIVTGSSSETVVNKSCTDDYRNVPSDSELQSNLSGRMDYGDAVSSCTTNESLGSETWSDLRGVREFIGEADTNVTSDDSIIGFTSCPSDSEEENCLVVIEVRDRPQGSPSLQPVISSPPGEAIEDLQTAALRTENTANRSLEMQPWNPQSSRLHSTALLLEGFPEKMELAPTDAEATLVRRTIYRNLLSWWSGLALANNVPQTFFKIRRNDIINNSQDEQNQELYLWSLIKHSPALLVDSESHSSSEIVPCRGVNGLQLFLQFLWNSTLLCSPH